MDNTHTYSTEQQALLDDENYIQLYGGIAGGGMSFPVWAYEAKDAKEDNE